MRWPLVSVLKFEAAKGANGIESGKIVARVEPVKRSFMAHVTHFDGSDKIGLDQHFSDGRQFGSVLRNATVRSV